MILVEKMSEKSNAMELIIRIRFVQFLKNAKLLQPCLVHHLVVTDNLDGHLHVDLEGISSSHYITEYSVASVPIHCVASVELLTDTHSWRCGILESINKYYSGGMPCI